MSRFNLLLFFLWLAALAMAGWIVSRLPLDTVLQSIAGLSPGQWLLWAGLNLLVIVLLTLRWKVLAGMLSRPIGFFPLLKIRQAGQAVSFLTPGPQFGGEPLQVVWLWKREGLTGQHALLSVGLDRFFELWINFSVLLLGVLLLLASPVVSPENWRGVIPLLVLVVVLLSLAGRVLWRHPAWAGVCLERLARGWRHHPRLQGVDIHLQALNSNLERIAEKGRPTLWIGLVLSICGWAGLLGELWLLLVFLGLTPGFTGFLLVLVATRVAFLLPLPGGIGTLETAVFWAFQTMGWPPAAALGLIALMRLRDVIIIGIGVLLLPGLRIPNEQDGEITL